VDPPAGSLPDTPKNREMLAKIRPAVQKYTGMGVRIEDDYALTETGVEWLSAGVPREIGEIEALMRQREPELAGEGTALAQKPEKELTGVSRARLILSHLRTPL
jgi:hypothetical protein